MRNNDKYRKILKVIILGASIFLVEFLVQILIIILSRKLLYIDLLDGNIKNPFTYGRANLYFGGALDFFYLRLVVYLPIWIITYIPGNSILNIRNPILRIISYNSFMILMTTVITFPISSLFFFSPFIYYLAFSVIITPMLIFTIPYFRNFLKSYVEKGIITENETV